MLDPTTLLLVLVDAYVMNLTTTILLCQAGIWAILKGMLRGEHGNGGKKKGGGAGRGARSELVVLSAVSQTSGGASLVLLPKTVCLWDGQAALLLSEPRFPVSPTLAFPSTLTSLRRHRFQDSTLFCGHSTANRSVTGDMLACLGELAYPDVRLVLDKQTRTRQERGGCYETAAKRGSEHEGSKVAVEIDQARTPDNSLLHSRWTHGMNDGMSRRGITERRFKLRWCFAWIPFYLTVRSCCADSSLKKFSLIHEEPTDAWFAARDRRAVLIRVHELGNGRLVPGSLALSTAPLTYILQLLPQITARRDELAVPNLRSDNVKRMGGQYSLQRLVLPRAEGAGDDETVLRSIGVAMHETILKVMYELGRLISGTVEKYCLLPRSSGEENILGFSLWSESVKIYISGSKVENGTALECKGGGKRENPDKTHLPVVPSVMTPNCENPGTIQPGFEPDSLCQASKNHVFIQTAMVYGGAPPQKTKIITENQPFRKIVQLGVRNNDNKKTNSKHLRPTKALFVSRVVPVVNEQDIILYVISDLNLVQLQVTKLLFH
ncbi:hypothetical protein PR048_015491 [Dryococelus australis]|uniref:Uncharacterized protein n=1 Tax=Dryococelus australis TaxID=614101 RepID=A0ABQ9HH35_9NEOP|nr:hypothetical protein PR048_015491 [Dryococelus australis]